MADYRPQIPAVARQLELYTFQDGINSVLDAFGVDGSGRHGRDARRAVIEAHRDLPNRHRWQYFQRVGEVTTVASQSTGTIEYDHTGGTYERQVTLTGATWPDEARFYRLVIDQRIYEVEERKSSTVLTLTQASNPGEDVAALQSYTLFRSCYPVPMDFRKGTQLAELPNSNWPMYVNQEWLLNDQDSFWMPQDVPDEYTIRSAGEHYGGLVFEFGPPPSTARTYRFVYEASPLPLRLFGNSAEYKEGTVSVSGNTVTGTSTAFTSAMVGCVLRLPQVGSSSHPTGIAGYVDRDEPYAEQRVIQSVTNATTMTLDVAPEGSYSGAKYTIGSALDFEMGAMYSCLLRLAEWAFARDQKERKDVDQRYGRFVLSMKAAMAADNRLRALTGEPGEYPLSLADIARM